MLRKWVWVNTEPFLEFIQHFVKHVSCSQKNPVLMIFDGHKSHPRTHRLCKREWSIFVITSTTHNTQITQPLDRAVFNPLKSYFNSVCQKWMRNHHGRRIQTENLGELFRDRI